MLGDFGRGKTFALRELARRIPAELPAPDPDPDRAARAGQGALGRRAGRRAPGQPRRGASSTSRRSTTCSARAGSCCCSTGSTSWSPGSPTTGPPTTWRRCCRPPQGKAKIVVGQPDPALQVARPGAHRARRDRSGCCRTAGSSASRTSPPGQIRAYLRQPLRRRRARGARTGCDLLSGIEDLLGLARNPRMLSFIADLDDRAAAAVAAGQAHHQRGRRCTRRSCGSWLAFEERPGAAACAARRAGLRADGAVAGGDHAGAAAVGERRGVPAAWRSSPRSPRRSPAWPTGELSGQQTAHAVGAGSLLVRTEEGLFGFIHASVMEWLVAERHRRASSTRGEAAGRCSPQAAVPAHRRLPLRPGRRARAARPGPAECSPTRPARTTSSRANAIKISTRLRTPREADLRGASCAGEDLSYRGPARGGPHRRRPDRRPAGRHQPAPAPCCAAPGWPAPGWTRPS